MQPLVILSGPTAVGKTALSLSLAKAIGGEIISADSMQVYRHMDIGTAKLPVEERQGIPHFLIDVLNPDEEFNVTLFLRLAKLAIQEIRSRNHIPIIVGGTGFYIQALLKDLPFEEEERDDGYRATLEAEATNSGASMLHQRLHEVDPTSANSIPAENVKRVIRALEYYHYHGEPISKHNEEQRLRPSPYNYAYFVLTRERSLLYKAINQRVDAMLKNGLVEELQTLQHLGYTKCSVAMQGLGYRQMLPYLEGRCTLEEAAERIRLETRHFAKRQLTWFRRETDIVWFDKDIYPNEQEILKDMLGLLREKGILPMQ